MLLKEVLVEWRDPNTLLRMSEADLSVNVKRRIIRFVICFVYNVFTFTSLGISSLKFLLYLTSCCSDLPILRVSSDKGANFIRQWGSIIIWNQDHSVRIKISCETTEKKGDLCLWGKFFGRQSWEARYLCGTRISRNILWKKLLFIKITLYEDQAVKEAFVWRSWGSLTSPN